MDAKLLEEVNDVVQHAVQAKLDAFNQLLIDNCW
jgi:hypothetical protein